MGLSIYDLINSELKSLGFFTSLLEAFDWDEEKTEKFCGDVSTCLLSGELESSPSLFENIVLFSHIPSRD